MSTTESALSATPLGPVAGVSNRVASHADDYREAFLSAKPFKHIAIDEFFDPAFAEQLLDQFPHFDPKLAVNEMGDVGGKAVNTKIREISPAYQQLYEIIGSAPFLQLIGRLSGIPDLILDPKLYGGGTHENLHGQDLDAHVDFNYDESQQLHRRLNLIVYLNKGWKNEWGGAIEIHSNPRDPEHNLIKSYDPLFNRAVMFETNEISWHGFPRINLPPDQRHQSRKSISIYLYTKTRPSEEVAPMHATFYVQRPLPEHLRPGYTLTGEDMLELSDLLLRRDRWIELYHRMEVDKNAEIANLSQAIRNLWKVVPVPMTGYALPGGELSGIYPDRWVTSVAELEMRPLVPIQGILVRGWRPGDAPKGHVRISVGDVSAEATVGGNFFELPLRLQATSADPIKIKIEAQSDRRLVDASIDGRDLQFTLVEIRAQHPLSPALKALQGSDADLGRRK
jgi:hypothetical protein